VAPDPLNVKRRLEQLDSLRTVRRELLPLPLVDRPQHVDTSVFGQFEPRAATGLRGKRVGVVGSCDGAAAVALVGVKRAFEEAGVEVEAISACSGAAIWGSMWAAGLSAQEMVDFSLSWQPHDHLDIQWTGLPRFALSALRGFTGLQTGRALEQLFDRRLWHMSAGETDIALHTAVYNMDRGEVRYFGSAQTPELTLGELVRIAAARPHSSEAVRIEGDLYVDGGVIDAFPAEPMVVDGRFDCVFAVGLAGALDGSGGSDSVARAELARRSRERLGESLTPIEPITDANARGFSFSDLFLDRRRWPDLMRGGYSSAVDALAPFSRARARRRA
jgi:predicted acylesterase/phospholipase RssA